MAQVRRTPLADQAAEVLLDRIRSGEWTLGAKLPGETTLAPQLGVGRSTAYELVRSSDLKCIRLRRRIVVPVAHLAESLGVDRDSVWATLTDAAVEPAGPPAVEQSGNRRSRRGSATMTETPTLF